MNDFFWVTGGGLGDCVYEYLHEPTAWLFKSLVEQYAAKIRVITCCHNSGVEDLFRYNPYVSSHVMETWRPPNPEDERRYANPIDGYLPLRNPAFLWRHVAPDIARHEPQIYLTQGERARLHSMASQRPLIVAQPFAGLSDRDGFDSAAFQRLVIHLAALEPNCRIICVGKNHERNHKYTREELNFNHPNLVNLIDQEGIRFFYHLVRSCDAFVGSHSNLIRVAWDARKRNACVLPWPLMENHLNTIDAKYTYGWRYPESAKFTFPMDAPGAERHFDQLDCEVMARFLLGK